ncbi:MAG: CHRD domain-containing protein [Gemmatimonadetes bacterium]|nr:CHRD domain-containing protein [Gemmatimonadota bacterium]
MNRSIVRMLLALLLVLTAACDDDEETGPGEERFTTVLSGANERPNPVTNTTASGTGTVTLQNSTIDVTVTVANLTGVTASHIHGPSGPEGTASPILGFPINSAVTTGTLVSVTDATATNLKGLTVLTSISFDSVLSLVRNGQAYINVHTSANPGGEIRGQLARQ